LTIKTKYAKIKSRNKENEMKKALFIIDPQKDFIDDPDYMGSLAVSGAYADMQRLSNHIDKAKPDMIVVTMDTHEKMHIANPMWWINEKGENPNPFTLITVKDVEAGNWRAALPEKQEHSLSYVKELAKNGKYVLCVWPYHCIEGTEGHKVSNVVATSLANWEVATGKKVEYVYKGQNQNTEMYSGLKAEVVIPEDNKTEINNKLIKYLGGFDIVEVAGEAKSHCVASTVNDLIFGFGKNANKIVILENCMSSVTGFEQNGDDFINFAKKAGCEIAQVEELTSVKKMKL
jgi:nicotinamidase-related amidase